MKRLVFLLLCIAAAITIAAQVGMSQGQSVAKTTPNPTKQQKVCSECDIPMGNITYAWQHRSWCPYYKPRSSGSSGSSTSFTTYTTASAVTSVLGNLLADAISPSPQTKTQKPEISKDKYEKYKKLHAFMATDEAYWNYGNYEVFKGTWKDGAYGVSYGIRNKQTGKIILNPKKRTGKEGDMRFFRNTGPKVNIPWYARIRLIAPIKGDGEKPYVFVQGIQIRKPIYDGDRCVWYPQDDWRIYKIDHNDELVLISAPLDPKTDTYKFFANGKWGIVSLQSAYGSTSKTYDIIFPAVYDSISKGLSYAFLLGRKDKYQADWYECVRDGKTEIFTKNHFEPIVPAFASFNMDHKIYEIDGIGSLIWIEKNGKEGAAKPNGDIVLPLSKDYRVFDALHEQLKSVSYTLWYKKEARSVVANAMKKGEFEKQSDYELRMKDENSIYTYAKQRMQGAQDRYLMQYTSQPQDFMISAYDSEAETYKISMKIAPWNTVSIRVPIAEAEAFKNTATAGKDILLPSIAAEAAKTAKYNVRYDAIAIDEITVTLPNGKTYQGAYEMKQQ